MDADAQKEPISNAESVDKKNDMEVEDVIRDGEVPPPYSSSSESVPKQKDENENSLKKESPDEKAFSHNKDSSKSEPENPRFVFN